LRGTFGRWRRHDWFDLDDCLVGGKSSDDHAICNCVNYRRAQVVCDLPEQVTEGVAELLSSESKTVVSVVVGTPQGVTGHTVIAFELADRPIEV
jgi:hypothetical protein